MLRMGTETAIAWVDHTWSPWEGCSKVSPGCAHCYASEGNTRWRGGANWGPGALRRQMSAEYWRAPLLWNRAAALRGAQETVFPSICDPFDAEAPEGGLTWFWALTYATPYLRWLLLTKRPERIGISLPEEHGVRVLPANVWLGTSVEDRKRKSRIDLLRQAPGPRFLSLEPLLEDLGELDLRGIDWVIVGGESGGGARPMEADWARKIHAHCRAAGVPMFFKQAGSAFARLHHLRHSKGDHLAELPPDLRVQQFGR